MSNPVLDAILSELNGARCVLDIGCGAGALARALTARGFDVEGIDPQSEVIDRACALVPDATFHVASAAALPHRENSFDATVFLNSLHHVPVPDMDAALSEAGRVTRPGGLVVVVEPMAQGPLFEVLRPIDDETEIRAAAQAAMDRFTLTAATNLRFDRVTHYANMEAFTASLLAGDPTRAAAIEANLETLSTSIARHGKHQDAGFTLVQPMLLRSFRRRPRLGESQTV